MSSPPGPRPHSSLPCWPSSPRCLSGIPAHPVPGIGYILTRSPSLNQVRHRRAALEDVDLLRRPPAGGFGGLDFKGAGPLIELGYRYTADALASSGLAQRFPT